MPCADLRSLPAAHADDKSALKERWLQHGPQQREGMVSAPALRVKWVRYGRPAAEALRRRVAEAKADDPLAPVTVVVPSNHVGVATRRLLGSGVLGPVWGNGGATGLAAVTFVTPNRLAELLGAPSLAARGRRPVSTPVIAAALRAALAHEPGSFAPVASHPATEAALVAAYRELREVSSERLDALAATGPRAADVVRLHRAARDRLEADWYDEQDLMTAAAAAMGDAVAAWLGPVVVFLPQQLSPHAAALLAAAAATTEVAVLAGTTGDAGADAEVATSIRRLVPNAAGPPSFEPTGTVDQDRTRVVVASDADDETRAAVRAVIDAVRTGTPLDRIALLYATPEPYARLAHEQLAAAGVKTNGPAVVPLAARVAGRTLLDLLALPERGFRRQDLFAWLASAPMRHQRRWAPTTAWERISREAGIVAGRADWDQRLAANASDLDGRAETTAADPDQPEWKADQLRRDAARAKELRAFTLGLIDDLGRAAGQPRRWGEHAAWAGRQLHTLLAETSRRDDWPEAERRGAERVEAALARLAALDAIEGPVGLDVFARTLALELEADLGRVGRFGEGVLVGPVTMGAGLDLDLVVLLGLAEGTFPATVHDDSLLPDHERARTAGELTLRSARVEREHRYLLAALAGAQAHVLGVPRGDLRRSAERLPSRWVLDIVSRLAGTRLWADDLVRTTAPGVDHVASFDAGLRTLTFPATEQEHRLRSLMTRAHDADRLEWTGDPLVARGARVVAARKSARFTRFDGNLAGLAVPSPIASPTSATRLERWAGCPFAYFVHDVLGVEAVENPEDWLQITPLGWGNLVHEALEQFIVEVLARPEHEQPQPNQPWSRADRVRLAAIGGRLCAAYEGRGLTGRPIFWRRDRARILADLERFLAADDQNRRRHGTRPIAAELAFGTRHAPVPAVPLTLPDRRVLHFRGKADRIDAGDDGTLHVVDYKTGRATPYRDLSEDAPDQRGRRLQLTVYGAAARLHQGAPDAAVLAEYWFVSAKGEFRRIGYPITDEVLRRVSTTLGAIVDGIEAGVFPPHPTAATTTPFVECPACDPDGLGVTELRRAWDRKRTDPALVAYAQLAEPLEAVDDALIEVEELLGG